MVQVELFKIIIDEKNDEQAVVLREKGGPRQIPIVIGFVEASSIQMRISGVTTPRPLTHDLLASVIQSLDAQVDHLLIDDLVEGTFFAKLSLKNRDGVSFLVDSRPSDGIALAVRLNIPMFVEEKIFQQALTLDM
jgi:bifunctional DNase/RNase